MLADEHVAKEMGVKAVPVETTWATCVLDLQASKADVQFGLQATPKRALEIDFAGPLYNLLVPQASNGGGPFPAVVVLHGCIGITGHFTGIADRLSSWGYVALAVDSLGPRGLADRCGVGLLDQAFDAYAALRYLSQLYFVDPTRVAVLGNSRGGFAVLYAVDRD